MGLNATDARLVDMVALHGRAWVEDRRNRLLDAYCDAMNDRNRPKPVLPEMVVKAPRPRVRGPRR